MSAELADESYGITITTLTSPAQGDGVAVYTEQLSSEDKTDGDQIEKEQLTWTISNCTAGVVKAHGSGSISASGSKVKCKGGLPLRKNDIGFCNGTYFFILVFHCQCQFQITSPGQSKVKGE